MYAVGSTKAGLFENELDSVLPCCLVVPRYGFRKGYEDPFRTLLLL